MVSRITIVHERGQQPYAVCACGARGEAITLVDLGESEPTYIPAALNEPCTCPRCFACSRLLDDDGRCETLGCLNLGLHIPSPD